MSSKNQSYVRAEQYLAPETLAQLAPLELRAKMIVEGVMSGMHRSPYQGMAVEFAQHRQYVPGDDLKHLDWKVYGRSDKLTIKQFQQETNLDILLLVDASASMGFGSLDIKRGWGGTKASEKTKTWTKFDHATAIATAVSFLCLHQQDRVGLVTYNSELQNMVQRSNSQGQWHRILNSLSTVPVGEKTNLVKLTDQALSKIRNKALFVIISDFFESPEAIQQSLARFKHRQKDVMLFQILDNQEIQFPFMRDAAFQGLESEGRVRVDPKALRNTYLEVLANHIEKISLIAGQFGFSHTIFDSHKSVGPAISKILVRRSALIKRSKSA